MDENDYFVLTNELGGPYCGLYDSPDDLLIRPPSVGEPSAGTWKDLVFKMDASVPGIVVPDFVDNAFKYLMVSERVKAWFEKELREPVEYLPFHVEDHRGVVLPATCYIVNLLGSEPCADLARTLGTEDPLNPPLFEYVDELHLDPAKLPPGRKAFRLGIRPQVVIVHRSIKEGIEAAGFTAASFLPMGGETP